MMTVPSRYHNAEQVTEKILRIILMSQNLIFCGLSSVPTLRTTQHVRVVAKSQNELTVTVTRSRVCQAPYYHLRHHFSRLGTASASELLVYTLSVFLSISSPIYSDYGSQTLWEDYGSLYLQVSFLLSSHGPGSAAKFSGRAARGNGLDELIRRVKDNEVRRFSSVSHPSEPPRFQQQSPFVEV